MEKSLLRIINNYHRGITTAEQCDHQIRSYFLWKYRTDDNSAVTERGWKEADKNTNLARRLIGLKRRDIRYAMMDRVIVERSR